MKLGLGTVQFGMNYGVSNSNGVPPINEVAKIFSLARSSGVGLVDTAHSYGVAESVLGNLHLDSNHWRFVTKLPSLGQSDRQAVKGYLAQSLERLGLNRVYAVLLHDANDLLGSKGQETYKALCYLKDLGMVSKIGVSVYSQSQIDIITKKFRVDVVQVPVNVLDQRLILSGCLDNLKAKSVEIHSRSSFLQGLLLMSDAEIPDYFNRFKPRLSEFGRRAESMGVTRLEAAIGFVNSVSQIDNVVVGVSSLTEFSQILSASKLRIDASSFADLAVEDEQLINPSMWEVA